MTTTQSLLCSHPGCTEKAKDMCLEHMSAFCGNHFQGHLDDQHAGIAPSGPVKKL